MKKNISIITNFGCEHKCWYCIWKRHSLSKIESDFDFKKIRDFVNSNKGKADKVSISGGGDPLYDFENNRHSFWDKIFCIVNDTKMNLDIHTRVRLYDDTFWKKIHKVALSSDSLEEDKEYIEYLSKLTKVRVVHVVTEFTTKDLIQSYSSYLSDKGIQLTLKELHGFDDKGRYDELKKEFQDLFFLDSDDYNIYYFPDNTIQEKFFF